VTATADLGPDIADDANAPVVGRRAGPLVVVCVATLVVVVSVALVGPWVAPFDVGRSVGVPFGRGGDLGWLGGDRLGRDVWSQVLHGGRRVVVIPLLAAIAATLVGAGVGVLAGSRPRVGWLDALLTVLIVLPSILVLLLMLYRFGDGVWVLVTVVVVVNLPFAARYTRGVARDVWSSHYVEQARLRGESTWWIGRREVLPNIIGPVLSDAGLRFVGSVYLITAASFLGFGPSAPATDWASMISENAEGASLNVWAIVVPAVMIALLTVPANLLADRYAASRRR
jgi:peptide/nickel transport system permease protein